MSTTIARVSDTTQTTQPEQVLGWSATRPSQNISHPLVASPFVDVTVNGVGPRTGSLTLLYLTEAAKTAAMALLTAVDTFQLSSTDLTSIGLVFALAGGGTISETYDADTGTWQIALDWQEIVSA